MLTQAQYTTAVYTAYRANAALVASLRTTEALGCYPDWNEAACQLLKIKAGFWSLSIQDYSSVASVDIYNQLLEIGSAWVGGIIFDPNAQIPGTSIIVTTAGPVFNESGPIYFNLTVSPYVLTISNWQTNYYPLYGDKPALLMIVTVDNSSGQPVWTQDTATVPTYSFVSNDPGQHTTGITWTFGAPTSGYILIGGLKP